MIRSFRHKGLKRLYEDDDAGGLNPGHAEKLRRILARLDIATTPQDLDLPGYRLHPLKGDLKGFWAVTVQANWRVTFRLSGGHVFDVDYIDYH
jgi:proteic killer suppression protein